MIGLMVEGFFTWFVRGGGNVYTCKTRVEKILLWFS